jgi:pyrroline-5-carboxylate reductase
MKTIGIIGFGNMGSAIAAGIVREKAGFSVIATEKKYDRALVAKKQKIDLYDPKNLVAKSDIIIIAVKPQELGVLTAEIGPHTKGKHIISIAAGTKITYFVEKLGTEKVTRFMPNLAAAERSSLTGIAFGPGVDDEFKKDCTAIAASFGTAIELPESLMPAVTGLSGSGIAFVFSFVHAMALGGVSQGIPYPQALDIAIATIKGAATVLSKGNDHPISLLSKVISPAGTTIRGVEALEEGGLTFSVMNAIERATIRAKELEG